MNWDKVCFWFVVVILIANVGASVIHIYQGNFSPWITGLATGAITHMLTAWRK